MSTQAAPNVTTAAPVSTGKPGSQVGAPRGDALTNFFTDGFEGLEETAPAAKPAPKAPKGVNAQQAGLEAEGPESEADAVDDALEGGEPEEIDEAEAKPALPEGKGTKEKPYGVKDLPADRFIELKIDGKKEIVSMAELAQGHIRQETFNRTYNEAKRVMSEATALGEQAKQSVATMRENLHNLFEQPDQLYEFLTEHAAPALDKVARLYARDLDSYEKNPQLKYQAEHTRAQRKLAAEREELQTRQQADQAERQSQASVEAAKRAFAAPFQAGLKAIGVLDPSKLSAEFRETVQVIIQAKKQANGVLTGEDVTAAVVRANQIHPVKETVDAAKPAPAAKPAAKPKPNGAPKPNGLKHGADFFLKGTRFA
jgi:hypothetical protein